MKEPEAITVAKKLVNKFISIFEVPIETHSDQGRNFEANFFQKMCLLLGITKTRTTVMHPQSDGMIEKYNQILENMLACFVEKHTLPQEYPLIK